MVKVLKSKSRFLFAIESLMSLSAVMLCMTVRYYTMADNEDLFSADMLFKGSLYIGILCLSIFLNDVYQVQFLASRRRLMPRLAKMTIAALLFYGVLAALLPDHTQGRLVFFGSLVLIIVLLMGLHLSLKSVLRSRRFMEQVLVVGEGPLASTLRWELQSADYHQHLIQDSALENELLETIARSGMGETAAATQLEKLRDHVDLVVLAMGDTRWPGSAPSTRSIGQTEDSPSVRPPNRIVSLDEHRQNRFRVQESRLGRGANHGRSLPSLDHDALLKGFIGLKLTGLPIVRGLDYYEQLTGRVYLGEPEDALFFTDSNFRIDKLSFLVKSVWERLLALTMFVMVLPWLALVPIAIWLEDRKSPLFVQPRVGRFGQVYKLYKWRSMDDQGRITRVGHLIRKTKLDELPQLINVLRGEMSLVGPRPEMPHFVQQFDAQSPYYALRHMVRPGLTGWAQIMFPDAKAEDAMVKLSLDLYYVKNFTLISDMVIMAETLKMIVFGGMARALRARPSTVPPQLAVVNGGATTPLDEPAQQGG